METIKPLGKFWEGSKVKHMLTENNLDAIHPIQNLPLGAEVPIEVKEWQLTRLNLMVMLNNEFNEYDKEIKEFLKENENFIVEKDIGFIDEYPLSIDYREPNVNDTPPYWQYLISCGGPGSEIRFFVNDNSSTKPYKVEFWFLEWSTAAKHNVTGEAIIKDVWEQAMLPLVSSSEAGIYGETQENIELVRETQQTDPLLDLTGTSECDVTEIKKQFKTSPRPKARVVKGTYEDDPDPLIALLGTLECDVTDIGERHDDYIGDALLAELWENEDE